MYKATITPFDTSQFPGSPWVGTFGSMSIANAWIESQKIYVGRKEARWIVYELATDWEKAREDERRTINAVVEIHVPDDATYVVTDETAAVGLANKERIEEEKIRMAPRVFAVLSAQNIENEFTIVEKQQQMNDASLLQMKTLVEHSAYLEAKNLLLSYTPTSYFTTPMKNKIINKIDEILLELGE